MANESRILHGPWPGERPSPALGPYGKIAVISDVHGNIPALEAVLAEIDASGAELIVHCGDLSWGPEPERTVKLVALRGKPGRSGSPFARRLPNGRAGRQNGTVGFACFSKAR